MSDLACTQPQQDVAPVPMSAWQRWEMSSIPAAPVSASVHTSASHARLTEALVPALVLNEAELAKLRLVAQQAGHTQGHQEGYAQGQAEGFAAGSNLAQAQAQSLRTLLLALPAALRAAEREVADDLLALALDVAHQMVGQTLTTEPQHILALVRELLRMEPGLNGTPRLLMHVDDAALVQQHLADDLHTAGWRIRTDLSITRGGCRVHAASGAIDATLETRWERVSAAFKHGAQAPKDGAHE